MSALLEFRKPQADIIKYPPSAIWRQRRKRRIRLPKGRKQLTKNELEKYFGKGWSFGSDSSMMSYEETRARADAVQAQRVRGERLAILDREVDNNRDRLRLEGEIANIDERVRMRQLQVEDQRFRQQIAQGREAEERQVALLEQGEERRREEAERFERVRAEENARHDRLYDEQRRFFQQQLEVGERRAGEMTARLTDALAQNRAQRGGDVPIRFFVAEDDPVEEGGGGEGGGEGGGFEDITTPRSTLKKTVSTVRDLLGRQPAPAPEPEPVEEEQQPLLSPTGSGELEERRRSFIEEGEAGGGSVRATETPKSVLERHRQSPQFRGRQRRGAVGAVPLRSGIEQEITDEGVSPPVEATRLLVKAQEVGGGAGGRSPRRLTKKEVRQARDESDEAIRELELGSPAVPPADIAQLERQLEQKPETAVQQLGKVASGVVSMMTGGGGGGVARVPVRSGEQSGGLGVAIQGEEGVEAEGVFGAQQGEETFLLPEVPEPATEEEQQPLLPKGQGVVEEEAEELEDAFSIARRTGVSAEELQEEQKRQRIERDRKRADRYTPIDWKTISKGQKDARKLDGMTTAGQLYLEVREPFDKTYVGANVGLYKVKNIPSIEGTGAGNTQKFNLTYKHRGFKQENQLNPYKELKGRNVFKEALADGKIRFVVRPKGAGSGDEV